MANKKLEAFDKLPTELQSFERLIKIEKTISELFAELDASLIYIDNQVKDCEAVAGQSSYGAGYWNGVKDEAVRNRNSLEYILHGNQNIEEN